VDSLAIAKGTIITIPIMAVNRSEAFWGPDAKEFKPERWLAEGGLDGAKEMPGYRHLLTFSDGPRICLGKGFALAEFKVTAALAFLLARVDVVIFFTTILILI
jgi:cytochrome P450